MKKLGETMQLRKDFIGRMIEDFDSIVWARELAISKKIFAKYNEEFLESVIKPFKMKSIAWFLGEKGKKWLDSKQIEYYHVVRQNKAETKVEEFPESVGGEMDIPELLGRQSLTEFLNG